MAREKKTAELAWLEKSNPLYGLSISQARAIFDCARSGDTQRLHWLYQEIETQNPTLSMCVTRRAGAAASFDYRIAERADMGDLAAEQKEAANEFFANIDNLADMFEHLDLAVFRGFAHAQPIWEGNAVYHVELLDSWLFLRRERGPWLFNPKCDGFSSSCEETANARLISIERRRPVDIPALAIHIRAAVGERDWGRFLERYALPKPAIIMAQNATEEDKAKYLEGGAALENGQVSVWPFGASITDFAGGSRGVDPFSTFLDHQEKTILRLATGGTLMSMAESGAGTLAGNGQKDVWQSIVARDSGLVAQAVNRSLLKPFLAAAFPGKPQAVDFQFDLTEKPTPKEIFDIAASARNAGYLIDQEELEEATGFTLSPAPTLSDGLSAGSDGWAMSGQSSHTPFQTHEKPFQNARRDLDAQGEGDAQNPLKTQNNASLEDALLSIMAQEAAKALSHGTQEREDGRAMSGQEITQEQAEQLWHEIMKGDK